jgi:hypothetical protein
MHPQLIPDPIYISNLLEHLVTQTSGCSVEQLEQIYSVLMSEIWKTRGDWDRGRVARRVQGRFDDVLEDINFCQGLTARSIEIEDGD